MVEVEQVNLRGEGGVVQTFDLPLSEVFAAQVDQGTLAPDDVESAKALGLAEGDQIQGGDQPSFDATAKAVEKADELGVDLSEVEGTGKDGRITVENVEAAAEAAREESDEDEPTDDDNAVGDSEDPSE